jgi:hypothetical protein
VGLSLRQGTRGAPGVDLEPGSSVPLSSTHQQCPVLGWHWEGAKGTSGSLIAVIAVLACVLVVVLVGGFLLYRRSKNQGAQYAAVTAEKPEL